MSRLSLYFSSDSSLCCKLKRISCIMMALRWGYKICCSRKSSSKHKHFFCTKLDVETLCSLKSKSCNHAFFLNTFFGQQRACQEAFGHSQHQPFVYWWWKNIFHFVPLLCNLYCPKEVRLPSSRWEIVPSAFTSACPRKTCPLEAHFKHSTTSSTTLQIGK